MHVSTNLSFWVFVEVAIVLCEDTGQLIKYVALALYLQYIDALKLCNEQNVMLTEDLVEKLTPEKSDDNESEAERIKVLEAIATVCMNQRQYHLATKKYTQAGNRIKVIHIILDDCFIDIWVLLAVK